MTYRTIKIQAPNGWELEYGRKEVGHREWIDDLNRPKFLRKGTFAGGCTNFESVHNIELKHKYNGSGPDAFGGAREWPVVEAHVAFNENEHELAVEFAQGLAAFIHDFLSSRER